MANHLERLSRVVRDVELLTTGLNVLSSINDESRVLDALAKRLIDAARTIQKKTGSFKPPREEQAWDASEGFRIQSQSAVAALLDSGKLKSATVLRRNLALIFCGPKHSRLDSKEVSSRKTVTEKRCERLRNLSPDGLIAWAVSYTPTSWAAGAMGNDVFDCLMDDIEPNDILTWPTVVLETLEKLRAHEDLESSPDYEKFMNAIHDPSRGGTDDENGTLQTVTATSSSQQPANGNREMKHIFTNAPYEDIAKMPQPFRRSVRNSELWKRERSQGYATTACWATLFPKDATQDVSVTIWCGHDDGYRLNDIFGVKHAMSS